LITHSLRDAVETNQVGAIDILQTMWRHLALELAINMTLILAAIPAAVALRASPLLAVPLAAACLAPLWMGALTATDALLDGCLNRPGCTVTYGDFLRAARDRARHAWTLAAVPTCLLLAASGTLAIMAGHPRAIWLVAPLLADGAFLVISGIAGLYAFSLGATTALRGRQLWIASLACAAAAPSITIASSIVIGVLAGVTALLGPGLLIAWPAPLALYLAAMTRSATGQLQQRRGPRTA
jgi:hypothetical protein